MRPNSLIIVFALLVAGVAGAQRPDLEQLLKGLSGDELAARARMYCQPESPSTAIQIPGWLGGAVPARLVPVEWWYDAAPADNYNIVGASQEFVLARVVRMPAQLDSVKTSGEGWRVGTFRIAGQTADGWMPDDDRRGDVARRMMYIGTMYPQRLWRSHAAMFYTSSWPYLSGYAKRVMMEWHRADPVDDRELKECAMVERDQLNVNPFVTVPTLAEYLWGDKEGQPFVPTADAGRSPLKSRYSISADRRLDLYSPYVPEGARWTVDGKEYTEASAELRALGEGEHTVGFTYGSQKGKMKFTVVP